MKRNLSFVMLLLSFNCRSQSLFEIKFQGHNDTTHYTCFLVYYNENEAYMRIRYYNRDGNYRVVEVRDKGETTKDDTGKSLFFLSGGSPRFITDSSYNDKYYPDYFLWKGGEALPYTTDTPPDANGQRTYYRVNSYFKIDVKTLTSAYLRTFYGDNENDYLALVKMINGNSVLTNRNNNATLHLIVLANTDIYDIGAGCKVDMEHMDDEFQGVAASLQIGFKHHLLSGTYFDKTTLVNTLNNLSVGANDIVIFVYRGHGFRWSDQTSPYPSLALTRSHTTPISSYNTILLESVYNTIVQKGARLNIVMADCCNSSVGVTELSQDQYLYSQGNASAEYAKLNSLFMSRQGNLLFAASEKGEVSWTSPLYGGYFTTSFLQSLAEEISYLKNSESSWVNIVANTRTYAISKSSSCTNCTAQHAIFYNQITKK